MRKNILLPACAVGFGAAGLLMRRWELASAFEPDTGLAIPNAPATLALIALSIAFFLLSGGVLWRMCRGLKPLPYDDAFRCGQPAFITAVVCSAALLLGGGLLGILGYVNRSDPRLAYALLALLAVLSGLCVVLMGRNNYRGEGKGRFSGPLLIPAYTWCLWLVLSYQSRAGDPIVLDYVYQLLAIICSLLGLYFMSGFSFEKGKPFLTLWAALLAVYFSCVTLADSHDWMSLLLYAFSIVYFTAHSVVLLHNLTCERKEDTHE